MLWTQVKWSEARQVARAMGLDEKLCPEEGVPPQAWYESALAEGALERAVSLLGHALPRYEAVAWVARLLEADSHRCKLLPRDQQALDRALRWLGDPSDDFRREAFEAAELASEDAPERMLGAAVFLSGGSMAPPDLPPVQPAPELCGRFAAAAVVLAAHRSGEAEIALREALAAGEAIAAYGLGATAGR